MPDEPTLLDQAARVEAAIEALAAKSVSTMHDVHDTGRTDGEGMVFDEGFATGLDYAISALRLALASTTPPAKGVGNGYNPSPDVKGLVADARAHAIEDHRRRCQGREYACTCGFDDATDNLIARLADALEALSQQRGCPEGWKPISEAPRDKTIVVGNPLDHDPMFAIADWYDADQDDDDDRSGWMMWWLVKDRRAQFADWATHWFPFPSPPTPTSTEKA